LIIPEDFRKDQYIVKPIIEAMMAWLTRPRASVQVLTDPNLGGVDRALDWTELEPIIKRYQGMVDLFILCVDRDGNEHRRAKLDKIEAHAANVLGAGRLLLAENAWQELEVWALAGVDRPAEWAWQDIRTHRDPKEAYFAPLAAQLGLSDGPGEGRRALGIAAARNYRAVRHLCQEDVQQLEQRIAAHLQAA
jgi:hypothetical protein